MQIETPDTNQSSVVVKASRDRALARLQNFLPSAGADYAAQRNFDFGPSNHKNVSMLSPYIRHRLVSEEEVLRVVVGAHGLEGAAKFVEEVFWRTYFKGWLEQRPLVWKRYEADLVGSLERLQGDSSLRGRYQRAIDGLTGIDCFDAWSQELVVTGYLHNHARMWFASIWVYTLKLPWQLGADFFYRHLLDGDPAANTLSWRWVCGLHTRGKTYLARADNIAHYTNGRFNPQGQLAVHAPPLEETTLSETTMAPLTVSEDRRVDGKVGLLITEEDCLPEALDCQDQPTAILGMLATQARSPIAAGEPAMQFAREAVGDAMTRCARRYGADCASSESTDWEATLIDWARENSISKIVTARPPVGPVAKLLQSAAPALGTVGIEVVQLDRRYDLVTWPHATQGFFKLKRKIPELLSIMGINPAQQPGMAAE